jgi:GT2 family glycosyltransferase
VPSVSVVVVTYNSRMDIGRCLASIPTEFETWVVDNASSDDSVEYVRKEFPHVHMITNDSNAGFGAANNAALTRVAGDFVLLLNPDAYAAEGSISALQSFLDRTPSAIACGGRLRHSDGSIQLSACHTLGLWQVFLEQSLLERVFHGYWISARNDHPLKVSQVMGACLMMRRVGDEFFSFDERFFLYCEDTELCHRLANAGEIYHVPQAEFTHRLGASSHSTRWRSIAYYNRGKELYFAIHYGKSAAAACFVLNRLGAFLRLVVWSIPCALSIGASKKLRQKVAIFARVLAAPLNPYPRNQH